MKINKYTIGMVLYVITVLLLITHIIFTGIKEELIVDDIIILSMIIPIGYTVIFWVFWIFTFLTDSDNNELKHG